MQCPFCKADNDKVIDSRASEGGRSVRRRRLCLECERRYTTYERIEESTKLMVIKKDGSRMPYDRKNVLAGLRNACYKRAVSAEALEQLVEAVEEETFQQFDREVTSRFIGEQVARRLRQLDEVAYVRFASVYREFRDIGDLAEEVEQTMALPKDAPGQQIFFEE
jgi:transcriptional repressor NrdR